eukprot:COSAG02_NODE_3881_length_6092_cov_50.388954_2_plen_1221_part_00
MSLRVAPTPPSAGSTAVAGVSRPMAESARDPRKILTSSKSPPFTAVSTPGAGLDPSSRLRPDPRHIGSPRKSCRPSRLNDSLSQSAGGMSGMQPGSAPSSLSVTWDSVSPDDDPAMSTLSREDKATFMRRYFFTERGYETDRMPAQKHFDVLMQDAPPEYAGDHLYCRYVDFMREGKEQPRAEDLGLIDEASNSPNTMVIAEWLRSAHPRTRLDACPMFFLTKQILINLMDGEVATANRLREQASNELAELREEHTAAMRAHADALDKAEDRYTDRETELLGEIDQLKTKLADTQTQIGALTAERDSSREECAGLQKEIKRLGSVEQILLADLSRNKEIQEGLKREVYETTVAVADAQAECAAEKQQGVELSNQILRLKDWKEDAEAEMRALQNDLAASLVQGTKLKEEKDALDAAISSMREEMYDLNEELAQAKDGADRLQREVERKLKAAANAGAGTSNDVRHEINHQGEDQLEQLEQELSKQRAEQRSLQRKLDEHAAQVAEELAKKEAETGAQEQEINQMVADADEMAKLLVKTPALHTMSAGADAPDWRKVEEMYRKAVYEKPESGDLKYKLEKAKRHVQKLNALEYGDAALRKDPSDFATALVAYKQAQELSPTVDSELEFAIQIVQHGLTFSEANTAAEHGKADTALKQYQEVLADLSWVEQVESLLHEPEPEPEPEPEHEDDGSEEGAPIEETGAEGDGISATADGMKIGSLGVELSIRKAPASLVASICGETGRPYAYGRQLAQCRKAAINYPHDPVVSAALRMASEEAKRSTMLRNRVKDQLEVVRDEQAKKLRDIEEAEAAKEAEEEAREAERAAMAKTISELEAKIEDSQKAFQEAKQAAAAQAEEATRAAEEAAAAQEAAAEAAAAEASAAIGADAEDMSPEEQLAAVKAMQRSTKEAQARSEEAIRKTTEEATRLRAEHEIYERNAVAYKLAQQKLLDEAERWKEELEVERQRSAAALVATDMAAESARAAERLRFGQSLKGLSHILTMGLAKEKDGFSRPDLAEMRQILLLMVDGGKPMEDAIAAAAGKIALANSTAQAASAPRSEPVSSSPPIPVETATMGCQTDYGYKRGYADSSLCTPDRSPWESPWSDVEASGPPDGRSASDGQGRHGHVELAGSKHVGLKKGGRPIGQKKTMKTVAIGASYSKGKNSRGNIGQIPVHASSVWWEKATAPLAVELKCATPPPGRTPAEWERSRPPKSKSAR